MTDISEAYLSRDGSFGQTIGREVVYYTFNEPDCEKARRDLMAVTPAFYEIDSLILLPRRNAKHEQINHETYKWVVDYGMDANQTTQSDPDANQFNTTLTFNLVGGTTHITTSLSYTNFSLSGAGGTSHTANSCLDVKGAIGWDKKSGQVRGVDVFTPVLDYGLTTQFPNRIVTQEYIDNVFDLTGKVNQSTFKGRPLGSVLFKGARGAKRGVELWEISFEFAYQKNRENFSVGGITVVNKYGWEYMDVMFGNGTSAIDGQTIQVPKQVNIHQVYDYGDFSKLRIGT